MCSNGIQKMDDIDFLSRFDGIQAGDMSSLLEQFEEASHIWNENDSDPALKQADDLPPVNSIIASDVQILTDRQDEAEFTEQTILGNDDTSSLSDRIALDTADCIALDTINEITVSTEPESYNDDIVILSNDVEYNQCDLDIINNDCFSDHNYCQDKTKVPEIVFNEPDANVECVSDDGEIMSDGENDNITVAESQCNNNYITFEKIFKPNCKNKRNYRRKSRLPAALDVIPDDIDSVYFDKIPTYYTALSIPNKNMIKKRNDATSVVTSGLLFTDIIPRDSSPVRKHDSDVLDKLPAYYSCFTNSTRYDENCAEDSYDVVELDLEQQVLQAESTDSDSHGSNSEEDIKYPWDRMRDKTFSAQSSRSQSPIVLLPGNEDVTARLPSRSSSRSSSRSRLSCSSCSSGCSSDWSVSPERTRDKAIRGQRQRNKHRSSYSSHSWARSHSRSHSRSRSPHRSHSRSWNRSRSKKRHTRSKASVSRSRERRREEYFKKRQLVKDKQMKDRRIVYVGRIPDNYTRTQLYRRFERFGDIDEVSVHFRENDDNYGFVTFAYTCDAYAAIEKGNRVPESLGHFDLCFGGRRQFCETQYADLDGLKEEDEEYDMVPKRSSSTPLDFDELLRQAQTKIKKSS